jgi:hypothetical protein
MTDMTRKELLKEAEALGLEIHHRANEETILNKINAEQARRYKEMAEAKSSSDVAEAPEEAEATPKLPKTKVRAKTGAQFAQEQFNERKQNARRLVRVRITCMNPDKRKLQGDYFSVGSANMGTIKRFVLFNKPWHVESAILKEIRNKKFSTYVDVPDGQGGTRRKSQLVAEYGVEILPGLTEKELADLAREQAVSDRLS